MRFSFLDGGESFPRVSSLASLISPSKFEVFFASRGINRVGLSASPNGVWVSVVVLAVSFVLPFYDLLLGDPQSDPGEAASVVFASAYPDPSKWFLSFCSRETCLIGSTTVATGISSTHLVTCCIHHPNTIEGS